MYTKEYYSLIKKNEIMPFLATWMDLVIIILSEVNQREKAKYYMILLICGIYKNKNKQTKNKCAHFQSRSIFLDTETNIVTKGKKGEEKLEIWYEHIHTSVCKIDNHNKIDCVAQETILFLVITYKGKESTKSLCSTPT